MDRHAIARVVGLVVASLLICAVTAVYAYVVMLVLFRSGILHPYQPGPTVVALGT